MNLNETMEAISLNMRLERVKLRMSQVKLAKKIKLSQASIAHIESGKKAPSLKTLVKIANGLGKEPWELMI